MIAALDCLSAHIWIENRTRANAASRSVKRRRGYIKSAASVSLGAGAGFAARADSTIVGMHAPAAAGRRGDPRHVAEQVRVSGYASSDSAAGLSVAIEIKLLCRYLIDGARQIGSFRQCRQRSQ